jgi:hypothetical protein
MSNIQNIAKQVLYGLITAKELDIPYYVKDNFDLILMEESDIFISDDDIIEHVDKMLSDKYTLKVLNVEREFESEDEDDNFFYGDIELKLIESE